MARGKSFTGTVGEVKGSAWDTAVACGAGHGLDVLELTPSGGVEHIEDPSINGKATARPALAGNHVADVSLKSLLRYEGHQTAIALHMGTAGVPTTVDTSGRTHVLKPLDDLDTIFSTVAWEDVKDTHVFEAPSVKWSELTIAAAAGQAVEMTRKGIASRIIDDSGTNDTTSVDSITLPSLREIAKFSQSVLWLNAQAGDALDTDDRLYVESWEVSIARATERVFSTELGAITSEPIGGRLKVMLKLTFPVLQDGTGGNMSLLADQLSHAAKKAQLTITSPTLAGAASAYNAFNFYFPYLLFKPAKPALNGAGKVVWSVEAEAFHVATIPTGFPTGYVDAVTITNTNKATADALA